MVYSGSCSLFEILLDAHTSLVNFTKFLTCNVSHVTRMEIDSYHQYVYREYFVEI